MIKQRRKKISTPGDIVLKVIAYTYFTLFSLAVLIPFYIMVKDSVTTRAESASTMAFIWFPKEGITFDAYKTSLFGKELEMFGISILFTRLNKSAETDAALDQMWVNCRDFDEKWAGHFRNRTVLWFICLPGKFGQNVSEAVYKTANKVVRFN